MRKNKLILLQIFIAFILICTSVYAATDATIDVTTSNTTVQRGSTVSVKLSLKDIPANRKVTSIEGYVNYNKDIIEEINVSNIEQSEDHKVTIDGQKIPVEDITNGDTIESNYYVSFNAAPTTNNDARIVIDFKDDVEKDTDLITINFKVKENATLGEAKDAISYSAFIITSGGSLDTMKTSEEITKSVSLTVKAASSGDNNNGDNNNNNGDNNNGDNNNNNGGNNNNNGDNNNNNDNKNDKGKNNTVNNTNTNTNTNRNTVDNTVAGMKLPATGAKMLIIPAIILIIIAYIAYNKYINMKDI